MDKNEAKKRIEKLKKLINHHRYLYHVLDEQEISDSALDSLKHELYNLEKDNPEFIAPDSPTQRVGGGPLKEFKKVEHSLPMLSIEDIFSEKELIDWESYLKRLEPRMTFEYFSEPKIDGLAVALVYEKGLFVRGATRGNGRIGEDVTQNLKTIESIPLNLYLYSDLKPDLKHLQGKIERLIEKGAIEIRGEVYMEKKDFERLNAELKKKGKKTYANPRNLAAGSIRQLDPGLAASRSLKFLAYDLVTDFGQTKHSQDHRLFSVLGFKTDAGKICGSIGEVKEFWKEIAKKRDKLAYQIDGVVISVNDNSLFKKLGVAGKSPRGIRAFKFSPKQAATKILDIKIQVGRTGVLTPIAVLEPVAVGGVTIGRATLHNEDEIKRLGVKIGDTVIVERAGDVIPAVARVLPELRTGREKNFHFPNVCPNCQRKVLRIAGMSAWRCQNRNCQAQRKEQLYHFVSKKAFDIRGLGPKIIDQLIDEDIISSPRDIFKLEEGDLLPLERFAEKSAGNTIKSIEKSKKISLDRFVYSLGIRNVGEETAIDLADYFGNIDKLTKASREELDKLPDVGPEVSKSIFDWFNQRRNLKLIEDLVEGGVNIAQTFKSSKKLSGRTFVLTGSLDAITRDRAKQRIRLLGGDVSESVSSKTDYLVAGKEPGSKLDKARRLGVKIINEKDFLLLIKA